MVLAYTLFDVALSCLGAGLIGAAAMLFLHGRDNPAWSAEGSLPSAVAPGTLPDMAMDAERKPAIQQDTVDALVESAPIIVWNRGRDGTLNWSGGSVTVKQTTVAGPQVATIIAARASLNPPEPAPGAAVERSRIEVSADGGSVPLHVAEVAGPDGTIAGYAVDATMAASAEGTLSRFVQTMTETFAHLTLGLAIFDRNRTLAMFNPALVNMWKTDPSWMACRPTIEDILEQLRLNRRIPEKGDFHEWRQRLMALFEDTDHVQYEEVWHLADGSSIRVLARPHPHGSLAFVFDDVSEQMKLEQRYRHSIDLRRATIDRLDEGIAVFGPDGLLRFVNAAFHDIWGTEADAFNHSIHAREVIQLCRSASFDSEAWERLIAFITAADVRRPWSARLTLGSGRVLSLRVASMPDGSSMVIFADITDSERIALALRERNEALEAAEEMRAALLDRLSQRLRAPLNTLFGYGQLLTDVRLGSLTERQRSYATGVLESASQLLDTIDDVTEIAALQIDALHDEGTTQNVWNLLEVTRDLLQKRAIEAGARLILEEIPDGQEHLVCDLTSLRQIVFNLVADAVHRATQEREIKLQARARKDALEVSVVESGGSGRETPGQAEQTGLTRSLIRRQIERAGGTLDVNGEDPGRVVSVCRFPALLGRADPPAEEPAEDDADASLLASIEEG